MQAKLREEIKVAMKARDQHRLDTLRGLLSEIKLIEIDSRSEVTEERFIQAVRKEIKKRKDTIEFAEKAGRQELVEQNRTEISILEPYLGDQLSAAQLRELVQAAIAGGADSIGKIMGVLNKDHKGKFDGKIASSLVKELLG